MSKKKLTDTSNNSEIPSMCSQACEDAGSDDCLICIQGCLWQNNKCALDIKECSVSGTCLPGADYCSCAGGCDSICSDLK